jgi:hypothetical protein
MYSEMHNNLVMPECFDAVIAGTGFEERKCFCDGITKYKINGLMKRNINITVQFKL